VTGDAICSLNPVYAQGMTVAISEAKALGEVVDQHGLDQVGLRFFRRTGRSVDTAWALATGADLGHPDVEGPRPARWRLINAYINHLLPVAHGDAVVAKAFLEVIGLAAPPQRLMHPRLVARVFTGGRRPAGGEAPPKSTTPQATRR
jgi:2-polyprenyl-6-methoxyphenol hydroxylase-like FAD-dependent oxidoreductase